MSNCCNKNVLDTYNIETVSVNQNAALPLQRNYVKVGNSIQHTPDSSIITIPCPGLYLINFSADGYSTAGTGAIQVSLQNNGDNVPGANAINGSSSETNAESLAFSKVIEIAPSCCAVSNIANLTFVNTGVPATFTSINVNIVKL